MGGSCCWSNDGGGHYDYYPNDDNCKLNRFTNENSYVIIFNYDNLFLYIS